MIRIDENIMYMVPDTRFELVTTSMSWRHSTAELIEQFVSVIVYILLAEL